MADVVAITRIEHGVGDGEVKVFEVGDKLGELDESQQESLVLGGSAVEIGKGRKFTPEPGSTNPDQVTVERDALIAKALSVSGDDRPSPGAALAEEQGTVRSEVNAEKAEETKPATTKAGTTGRAGSA